MRPGAPERGLRLRPPARCAPPPMPLFAVAALSLAVALEAMGNMLPGYKFISK